MKTSKFYVIFSWWSSSDLNSVLLSAQNPRPSCVVFSWQYGVELRWPEEVGKMESKPKSYPKRHWGQSSQFHSNFLCNGAELSCWGTDYKPAGYVKRKQDFFPEGEPSCCSKRTWQSSSLLTLHTELREASVRGPGAGKQAKLSKVSKAWPADQRQQGLAQPGLGEVQMWRHPSPGPAWPPYCPQWESWGCRSAG